jgi:hypothetical protein
MVLVGLCSSLGSIVIRSDASQAWYFTPVIPATWDAGESL